MTIEDKLREIVLAPVGEADFDGKIDEYFYELCVKAFNYGLEVAAEEATASIIPYHIIGDVAEVDKKSILDLKI